MRFVWYIVWPNDVQMSPFPMMVLTNSNSTWWYERSFINEIYTHLGAALIGLKRDALVE